jgi:hypothetical protein
MTWNASRDFIQDGNGRTNLTGRAITALIAVMFDEGSLHGVKIVGRAKAFDRRNLIALMLDSQAEASVNPLAVNDDRTGTALSVITTFLRPGKLPSIPQRAMVFWQVKALVAHKRALKKLLRIPLQLQLRRAARDQISDFPPFISSLSNSPTACRRALLTSNAVQAARVPRTILFPQPVRFGSYLKGFVK